jgi:hypothetical protein
MHAEAFAVMVAVTADFVFNRLDLEMIMKSSFFFL